MYLFQKIEFTCQLIKNFIHLPSKTKNFIYRLIFRRNSFYRWNKWTARFVKASQKFGINHDKWPKNTLVFQLRSYRGVIVVYESRRRRGERATVSSEITTPVSVNQLAFHPYPGSETGRLVPVVRAFRDSPHRTPGVH